MPKRLLLLLKKMSLPTKLDHYTMVKNCKSIDASDHLNCSSWGEAGRGVYLTDLTWKAGLELFDEALAMEGSTHNKTNARWVFDVRALIEAGYEIERVPHRDRQFIVRKMIIISRVKGAMWESYA